MMAGQHGATAVVFDFGRVVFDWQPEALLARVLPSRVHSPETASHWVGLIFQGYGGDWGDFDRGDVDVPALVERIAVRTGLDAREVRAVVEAVPESLRPLPGTVALVDRLKRADRQVFYLSNMPLPFAEYLERHHPFMDWFKDGVFSSRARANKPEPAIYAYAEARFGLPVSQLLFIDDHRPNIDAARGRGWEGIVFDGNTETLERELARRGLLS